MQRIYHRPLTVQRTGIVLPASTHRTSAARLLDRSLSAWGNNHYRGVIGALLPSVVAGSLPRRYTQEQQPTSRHTTVQIFTSGTPLTRAVFTQHIQRALTETGVANSSRFMSHSFRIGAATTAAEVGVPAWLIKTMGRWSSDAYQQYIRTPLATRLAVARQLTPLRRSEPSASTSTQSRPSPDTQPHS